MNRHPVRLTFTGIDARTDLDEVMRIGKEYQNVEFAVLVGSRTGIEPRFPGLEFTRLFRRMAQDDGVRTSIHLCGVFSREVNVGDFLNPQAVVYGFGRCQVNSRATYYDYQNVERFGRVTGLEVIVQCLAATCPRITHLHDKSGGRGINTIASWPSPRNGSHCGFAGGITPDNVLKAVDFIHAHPMSHHWLDMESGVRTDDWFDLEKVMAVINEAGK